MDRTPPRSLHPSSPSIAARVLRRGARILVRPLTQGTNWLGVLTAVRTTQPAMALTFDDGPDPQSTPALLDILARHGARATFFMVGELAARHPHIVKTAAGAGHAIGNHSWSHLSFPLLTTRERQDQLRRCQQALEPYGSKLFRPPYCHQSAASRWQLLRSGYDVVGFSVHAEDWLARPASWMRERLVRQARPGAIVILHDSLYRSVLPAAEHDRKPMLAALDGALAQLKHRYRFVTVPELLRLGKPIREHWYGSGVAEMRPALQRNVIEQRQATAVSPS